MFKNDVIMHDKSLDVAFKIHEVFDIDDQLISLYGHWINLGYCGTPFSLSSKCFIHINDVDVNRWVTLSSNQITTPRKAPGLPK